MSPSSIVLKFNQFAFLLKPFLSQKEEILSVIKKKAQIQGSPLADFSLSSMATLGNRRKLAAVSRETPESNKNSRAQKTVDPELTQDYNSQVSEEIEGRVTKKLSKEFSRTESRIFVALSNLDEFLLNPQVRNCFVAVPGTFRNGHSENRETTGHRSSNDPCPEVRSSSHQPGHLNNPEVEEYPHMVTGVTGEIRQYPHMTTGSREGITFCSPSNSSGKKRRRALFRYK